MTSPMAVYGFGDNYDLIDWSKEDDKYNVYVPYKEDTNDCEVMESN